MGGMNVIQSVDDIHFSFSATIPEIGQSASPDASAYLRPLESEGIFDLANNRFYQVRETHYLGSGKRGSAVVTTPTAGFTVDLRANALYPFGATALATSKRTNQRTFPFLQLQAAASRGSTLRWLGRRAQGHDREDAITFSESDGSQTTLYFDTATGMLTAFEGLSDTFLDGSTTTETRFSDYRRVNGLQVPFHAVTRANGVVRADVRYHDIRFNEHPDARHFERPADATLGPEVGGARRPITITPIAKDVYYVDAVETGSIFFYSSMFVAFKDYVLVIEAPLNDGVSQAIIAKIKETVPGKPIRYLVPTHYHIDHSGGIRGYVAEGSTIVTPRGNLAFLQRLAAIAHPLSPDRLSLQPRGLSTEVFDTKRVFSDSDHVVELYNLRNSPHADDMVLAYLPRERIVFVSDLFLVSLVGRLGPAEPLTLFFDQKLRELNLHVETIVGGHGRMGTMDELRRSVSEATGVSTAP